MERQVEAAMPTIWGPFQMIAYSEKPDDPNPHLALVRPGFDPEQPVLVRIHSECMTGDLFGSRRCDCGEQLHQALQMVAEKGGVIIYLRQEGRGIGLINKLKAYNLQDAGLNTVDANVHLGLEIDARGYELAIEILEELGIQRVDLLTNNPEKLTAIEASSIEVANRVPLVIKPQEDNKDYLQTKQDLMGHLF